MGVHMSIFPDAVPGIPKGGSLPLAQRAIWFRVAPIRASSRVHLRSTSACAVVQECTRPIDRRTRSDSVSSWRKTAGGVLGRWRRWRWAKHTSRRCGRSSAEREKPTEAAWKGRRSGPRWRRGRAVGASRKRAWERANQPLVPSRFP